MSKLAIVTIFAILAICQASFFLPKKMVISDDVQSLGITGGKPELTAYFNGLWGYFGLTQSAAANCYNNITAPVYWQVQTLNYQLAGAYVQGNHTAFNAILAQLRALNSTIAPAFQCERNTTDYANLLRAAGANTTNMTHFRILESLYDQAHLPDWYFAYTPIYAQLNGGRFSQAGVAYGPIMRHIFWNSSDAHVWFEAFEAFQNGIFYWVNASSPYQLPRCFDADQGRNATLFYFLWSEAVANSSPTTAVSASDHFFNTTGRLFLQYLMPVRNCFEFTNDQARLNKAVGYDVYSFSFEHAMRNWMLNNQAAFFNLFSAMHRNFLQHRPENAGSIYGEFYILVAASIKH